MITVLEQDVRYMIVQTLIENADSFIFVLRGEHDLKKDNYKT